MAEFCLDCMNRLSGTHLTEADVILLDDLCEGCGEIVPCVVCYRSAWGKFFWKLRRGRKRGTDSACQAKRKKL